MVETRQSEGHIVKDFMLGDTHIKICDDFCLDKTQEEVQNTLDRIAEKTQSAIVTQETSSIPCEEQARRYI